LGAYQRIMIVHVDMVTSNQIQMVRGALRGKAEVLMGKNTLMRKAIRDFLATNPGHAIERINPLIKTNVGLIFTNEDLKEIRTIINTKRVDAPARTGIVAPQDVTIPAQQTALEPTQTSFFQALNVPTKINKGAIEILNPVHIIKKGERVGPSESALLAKLNIKPFSYGLEVVSLYDNGSIFGAEILDIDDEAMAKSFASGVATIAAIGLEIGYPTLASLPYSVINAFKNVLAVALEIDYDIPQVAALKAAASAPKAAAPAKEAPAKEAPKAAAKKEESEEEDMGFGLFD